MTKNIFGIKHGFCPVGAYANFGHGYTGRCPALMLQGLRPCAHVLHKKTLLLLTVALIIFTNCNIKGEQYNVPQKIIVAGKIDNYDSDRQISLSVCRLGIENEKILAKTDSLGNFMATFESYIPVSVFVMYKTTNFIVILNPNDSLFVQFDGKYNDRPELLETIKFGGNAAATNRYAAIFQKMYFSNEIYSDWNKKRKATKEYDADQYLQYMDTIQQKSKKLYDQFVAENKPNDISKNWARLFLENDYYHYIAWYATDHREANKMGRDNLWDVPKGFYDVLCNRLPINADMLIEGYGLSGFCNTFFGRYISNKIRDRATSTYWIMMPDGVIAGSKDIVDSLVIFSTIEFAPDPLLLQIMLTESFSNDFRANSIDLYERYRDIANAYIKEPFLKEPLFKAYLQTKSRIENPQIYTETILKEAANLSVKQIMDDILQPNKGKVIYIDFWGTWCGPCLSEMPNSKIIEHELKNEDVVFVYVCLESQEKQWKATLDKFQLGGQHYLLSYKQSAEIRSLLSISGVPFYVLVDKNGVIKEKGSHLRPFAAKQKIKEILK